MAQASNASNFVLNFINSRQKLNDSVSKKSAKPLLRMLSSSDSSSSDDEQDENGRDIEPAWKRKLARRQQQQQQGDKQNYESPRLVLKKSNSQKIQLEMESGSEDNEVDTQNSTNSTFSSDSTDSDLNKMHNSSNGVIHRLNSSTHSAAKTLLSKSDTKMNSTSSPLNSSAISKVSANINGNKTANSNSSMVLGSGGSLNGTAHVLRSTPTANASGLRVNGAAVSYRSCSTYGTYSGVGNPEMQKKGITAANTAPPPAFPTNWKDQTPTTSKTNRQKNRSLLHTVIHKPREKQSIGHPYLSRGSSEEPESFDKSRKVVQAKPVKNEDPRITRLKKYISTAGLRPKYDDLLNNAPSDDHKVRLLEEYLVKKGVQKPFGMDRCLQYKADQDFKREIQGLEILNPTLKSQVKSLIVGASDTRVLRSQKRKRGFGGRKGGPPEVVTLDSTTSEEEDEDEEDSDSDEDAPRGPKRVFSSIADIVSSEADSD